MNSPVIEQKTNPNLTESHVEQTLPSKEELQQQIEQLINEDYQRSKGLSFGIMMAIALWVIVFGAIWHAWI